MPTFPEHLAKAASNLQSLEQNNRTGQFIDWQVTMAFYAALHLIDAHLVAHGLEYEKHIDRQNALNPHTPIAPAKLPVVIFNAYMTLAILSRKSRYSTAAINHRHLAQALRSLETVIVFIESRHAAPIAPVRIFCRELAIGELPHFSL